MTPKQIRIVQASFAQVAPIADVAAELFYARLFELDPQLRLLFKADMKRQGAMLMSMLASAVRSLENPEPLVPVLKSLGRRHVTYGVSDAHYGTVGRALLDTLAHAMGPAFDEETKAAWASAYDLLSSVMKVGAREVAPASEDGKLKRMVA